MYAGAFKLLGVLQKKIQLIFSCRRTFYKDCLQVLYNHHVCNSTFMTNYYLGNTGLHFAFPHMEFMHLSKSLTVTDTFPEKSSKNRILSSSKLLDERDSVVLKYLNKISCYLKHVLVSLKPNTVALHL